MRIAVILPYKIDHAWQIVMTRAAAETLACTTDVPFDLVTPYRPTKFCHGPIDLVSGGERPMLVGNLEARPGQSPTQEINNALDMIERDAYDFVVYTGNDIFVRPGWLEALLEPWEQFDDTGCTTVWSSELRREPSPGVISEGVYGPFMMFRPSWRYDEQFTSQFADTDLVMRIYAEGLRSYRNHGVVIHHLLRQTVEAEANQADFEAARQRFIDKHAGSPLLMYQILAGGKVI